MFRGKLLWALAGIIIFILLGTGIIIFTYQRASSLNDLRYQTDNTIQSMYRLTNNSFALLFSSEDISEAQIEWYESYDRASKLLDSLAYHEGLDYIDPSIASQIRQTRDLWNLTTNSFIDGNNNLHKFLAYNIDQESNNNINDLLTELEHRFELQTAENNDKQSLSRLSKQIFTLRQAYISIDSANDHLWFFTTASVENLGSIINNETGRVIRIVLIIAGTISLLLLAIIITAFIISQRILHNANVRLEQQVKERTQSIQNLLDYSEEGFLSFGADFLINPEISKECFDIFGENIAGKDLSEILYQDEQARTDFKDAMTLIFEGVSLPEVIFEVVDSKISINSKTLKLDFHLVNESTVMCQLDDITETELLQKQIEEENLQREMVLRVVTSKRDFLNLTAEANELFAALESCISEGNYCANEEENDDIVRALHTFKANAAFLRMSGSAEKAHELETTLIDYGILSDATPLGEEISSFKGVISTEIAHIIETLGQDWLKGANSVEVDLEKLESTRKFIYEKYPDDFKLQNKVDQLASLQLNSIFVRLSDQTEQLARSNGKRISVEAADTDILVSTDLFRRLSDSVSHILRNMVTHGIEFPGHREKAGKPLEGRITVDAVQNDGHIELQLSDDGAGLSVQKIREKAIKAGRISADDTSLSDNDYIKMIFQPGFSTSDTVTAVSGRGYGLSAVKESIYEIGGKIKVATTRGRGTKFTIIVPNKEKEAV